ncbi:MAG: SDR family oxidoreductase [Candidatus Moranbacteria bacterium]|nr:SDR family oxidoreductase [Candidatus Moranbacteria bacterium]
MRHVNEADQHMKVVLIIGGTSGIGLATALLFREDHKVIIIGRNIDKIAANPELYGSLRISFDVSDLREIDRLLRRLRPLEISKIVHCAGIFRHNGSEDEAYREAYRATKMGGVELIRRLMAQDPGRITHVCAVSSLFTLMPDPLVPSFEKSVQKELERAILGLEGAISNCVAPSLVRTPMIEEAYGERDIEKFLSHSPGSRILEPIEVAREINFLCSQERITDKVIPVDGGYLKNLTL